jgi:iron(III) transport system permease protein
MRAAALAVSLLLLVPLAGPAIAAVRAARDVPVGWVRLAGLAGNTLALAAVACAVAVPTGVLSALALERVKFPGRGVARALVVATLFVPLPVVAVAWQVLLGAWWRPLGLAPGEVAWQPWAAGLLPAGVIHGAAGWPWVTVTTAVVLRRTDPQLEEEALLEGGAATVLRRVLRPRLLIGAAAGGAWVGVQALTEIAVTDMVMVRTFAEEVYTQQVVASEGIGATLAVTTLPWLALVGVGMLAAWRGVARLAEPGSESSARPVAPLPEWCRASAVAGPVASLALFALLPAGALVWVAGGGRSAEGWTAAFFAAEMRKVFMTDGVIFAGSCGVALVAGVVTVSLAITATWGASRARGVALAVGAVAVTLALTPGPVVGLGLKRAIGAAVDAESGVIQALGVSPDFPPLRSAFYDQPSPLPAVAASVVRFFPLALLIVTPAFLAVAREVRDAVRLDGLGVVAEWRRVVGPAVKPAAFVAVIAVAALSLGEVSASKLVNPPGRDASILRLFDQMHYGADTTVAALALLPLLPAALFAWLVTGDRDR